MTDPLFHFREEFTDLKVEIPEVHTQRSGLGAALEAEDDDDEGRKEEKDECLDLVADPVPLIKKLKTVDPKVVVVDLVSLVPKVAVMVTMVSTTGPRPSLSSQTR